MILKLDLAGIISYAARTDKNVNSVDYRRVVDAPVHLVVPKGFEAIVCVALLE